MKSTRAINAILIPLVASCSTVDTGGQRQIVEQTLSADEKILSSDFEGAIEDIEAIIQGLSAMEQTPFVEQRLAKVYIGASSSYHNQKDHEKGTQYFDKAFEIAIKSDTKKLDWLVMNGYMDVAEQLMIKGDHPGCELVYRSLLRQSVPYMEKNPNTEITTQIHAGLGRSLLNQTKYRQAIPFLEKAASEGHIKSMANLVSLYHILGQEGNQKKWLDEMRKHMPGYEGPRDRKPELKGHTI